MVDCCCCNPPPRRRDRRSIRPVAVPVVVPGDHHQMSDATTKEGHVNYDVSDVLVEARAAPTTGRGCYGWVTAQLDDAKNRQFFSVGARDMHPADAIVGTGRIGRGLGKGGGVLLTRATASFLVEDMTFTMMEIAPLCSVIYGI
jgi:hypothetical protein